MAQSSLRMCVYVNVTVSVNFASVHSQSPRWSAPSRASNPATVPFNNSEMV